MLDVCIGRREGSDAKRYPNMQNPQKMVQCTDCKQQFQTHNHMMQHWADKHGRESRQKLTNTNVGDVSKLRDREEELKRTRHAADQELLAQQQSAKHALYDQEEQKIIVALADRDLAVKEREAAVQSRGQEQRNKIEESARDFNMHQTRQLTVSNLEHEIKQESIQILKLLQSVQHEVCIFFCASALYSSSTVDVKNCISVVSCSCLHFIRSVSPTAKKAMHFTG